MDSVDTVATGMYKRQLIGKGFGLELGLGLGLGFKGRALGTTLSLTMM